MESLKRIRNQVGLLVFVVILILSVVSVRGNTKGRINPLRLGVSQKSWQLTLNLSRYVDELKAHSESSRGLWEEEKTICGTFYQIQTSFDLNKSIAIRGSVSYRSDSIKTEATNLWTGTRKTNKEITSKFGRASFKIKVKIWENSELRTHLLVPVLGGSAGAGLVWSRDPVMVFPKLTINGKGFGINTGVSFVANSKVAITGRAEFRKEGDKSLVGFGGGLVYRDGEYDGVQVSASLQQGSSTQVSLEIGLSYGKEKS